MKKLASPLLLGLIVAACSDDSATAPRTHTPSTGVNVTAAAGTRYMILFNDEAVPADIAKRVAAAGGTLVRTIPQVGIAVATAPDSAFATALAADARVLDVLESAANTLPDGSAWSGAANVPDLRPAPLSATAPTAQDDLYNGGLVWGIARVGAPNVWGNGAPYTGAGARVAIIDAGIASNHPDLATNLTYNACFSSAGDVIGRGWQAGDPCIAYPAYSDHGTHVAGTVAAAFGGGRVVGVAPNAQLWNYNTFEPIAGCGVCTYSDVRYVAMVHAAERGATVINMSLGGVGALGNSPIIFGPDAEPIPSAGTARRLAFERRVASYVNRRGTVLVTAAGNNGLDLTGPIFASPGEMQGNVTVGATGIRSAPRYPQPGATDVKAFYSNYGSALNVAAPGGDCGLASNCAAATRPANWFEYLVLSSIVTPNVRCARTESCDTGYGWKGGTSMAAPHVAGVAALARAVKPSLTAYQTASLLASSAQPIGDRMLFGAGMVSAVGATQ